MKCNCEKPNPPAPFPAREGGAGNIAELSLEGRGAGNIAELPLKGRGGRKSGSPPLVGEGLGER